MNNHEGIAVLIVCILIIIISSFLGFCVGEDATNRAWERKIRKGQGPALINAIMLEDEARKARIEAEREKTDK